MNEVITAFILPKSSCDLRELKAKRRSNFEQWIIFRQGNGYTYNNLISANAKANANDIADRVCKCGRQEYRLQGEVLSDEKALKLFVLL